MWSFKQLEQTLGNQATLDTPKQDVKAEILRRKSQYTRMLELLQDHKEVTNLDLAKISFRYSARIGDMRKDGHKIVAMYERPGVWRYIYRGHTDEQTN